MKKLVLLLVAAGSVLAASAQRAYFAYFQTEDQAPFYVRIADKIYSSAASGYLILPNLHDSSYTIHLGFAKSTAPETRFTLAVNQSDKGYLIKNFTDGVGLFDMQNLSIVKSSSAGQASVSTETRSDRFSTVLSKAADDPSLLQVARREEKQKPLPTVVVEETKTTTLPVITEAEVAKSVDTANTSVEKVISSNPVQDTSSTATVTVTVPPPTESSTTVISQLEATIATIAEEPFKRSLVRRYAESSTTEGLGVIYFDQTDAMVDTIRILIPPSKSKLVDETTQSIEVAKSEQVIGQPIAIDSTLSKTEAGSASQPVAANTSSCNSATEKDFMKLRKNMAGKQTDEDMIAEARKAFKSKCFTTEQLRYLGSLFLTSAARYQFFDAAYNHVSDKQAFNSLQTEIKDEYYLKRFKALVGE